MKLLKALVCVSALIISSAVLAEETETSNVYIVNNTSSAITITYKICGTSADPERRACSEEQTAKISPLNATRNDIEQNKLTVSVPKDKNNPSYNQSLILLTASSDFAKTKSTSSDYGIATAEGNGSDGLVLNDFNTKQIFAQLLRA